jgi:hypothetical protein
VVKLDSLPSVIHFYISTFLSFQQIITYSTLNRSHYNLALTKHNITNAHHPHTLHFDTEMVLIYQACCRQSISSNQLRQAWSSVVLLDLKSVQVHYFNEIFHSDPQWYGYRDELDGLYLEHAMEELHTLIVSDTMMANIYNTSWPFSRVFCNLFTLQLSVQKDSPFTNRSTVGMMFKIALLSDTIEQLMIYFEGEYDSVDLGSIHVDEFQQDTSSLNVSFISSNQIGLDAWMDYKDHLISLLKLFPHLLQLKFKYTNIMRSSALDLDFKVYTQERLLDKIIDFHSIITIDSHGNLLKESTPITNTVKNYDYNTMYQSSV